MTCRWCKYLFFCLIFNNGCDKKKCIYEKELEE